MGLGEFLLNSLKYNLIFPQFTNDIRGPVPNELGSAGIGVHRALVSHRLVALCHVSRRNEPLLERAQDEGEPQLNRMMMMISAIIPLTVFFSVFER